MAKNNRKFKRFDKGGLSEEEYKQKGLEESGKKPSVSFLRRLMMGNIDDPQSEAYRQFGAGRGRALSVPIEDREFTPVRRDNTNDAASATPASAPCAIATPVVSSNVKPTDNGNSGNDYNALAEAYPAPAPAPAPVKQAGSPAGSTTKPDATGPSNKPPQNRPAQAASRGIGQKTYNRTGGEGYGERQAYIQAKEAERIADMLRNPERQAIQRVTPEENLIGGPGLKAVGALAKKLAKPPAPARDRIEPEFLREYIQPLLPGRKKQELLEGPGNLPRLSGPGNVPRLPAPPKRLSGPGERPRQTDPGKIKSEPPAVKKQGEAAKKRTRKFNEDEDGVEFKQGGKVKKPEPKVTMASRRGDGIALRGKTRGGSY